MSHTLLNDKPSRIKEERKRLGLTQEQAAEKCGIRRQQWIRYEKGASDLDGEPLRKFGEAGASVGYILTGEKSNVRLIGQFQAKPDNQTKELMELFNSMTPEKQEILMQTAKVFAKESGFTDLQFSIIGAFCGFVAMIFLAIGDALIYTNTSISVACAALTVIALVGCVALLYKALYGSIEG